MASSETQLDEAEALARFANLDSQEIKDFRQRYPKFAPEDIWGDSGLPAIHTISISSGHLPQSIPTWQSVQHRVQEIWNKGFPAEDIVQFIAMVAGMSDMSWRVEEIARKIQQTGSPVSFSLPKPEIFACQRAAMFLGVQPWRAMFCGVCGKRFVADKPGRKFCSEGCAERVRKANKRAWWREHGQNWREGKQKKIQKQLKKGGK